MHLASGGNADSQWDDVMFHLARWLVRHLDDPRLVIWIAERGGQVHDRWLWLIEHELDRVALLELEGKSSEINEIRLHAPKAIPGALMRTLWRLLLSGRVKSPWQDPDFYRWKRRLKREGLTATLRLELRELLAPKVVLKKPFRWSGDSNSTKEPTRIKELSALACPRMMWGNAMRPAPSKPVVFTTSRRESPGDLISDISDK
jgi:hypothetical protein